MTDQSGTEAPGSIHKRIEPPVLNDTEQDCMDHILAAMQIITTDWKLRQGSNLSYELCLHVHGMQSFVSQHMLQRVAPQAWGAWYDDPALIGESSP